MGKCCAILFCKILVQECECSVQFLSYNLSEDLKQSSSFPRHFSYRVSFISRWMLSQKERKIVKSFYFACKKKFMLNIFRFERFLKWTFPFKLNQQKEQIMKIIPKIIVSPPPPTLHCSKNSCTRTLAITISTWIIYLWVQQSVQYDCSHIVATRGASYSYPFCRRLGGGGGGNSGHFRSGGNGNIFGFPAIFSHWQQQHHVPGRARTSPPGSSGSARCGSPPGQSGWTRGYGTGSAGTYWSVVFKKLALQTITHLFRTFINACINLKVQSKSWNSCSYQNWMTNVWLLVRIAGRIFYGCIQQCIEEFYKGKIRI